MFAGETIHMDHDVTAATGASDGRRSRIGVEGRPKGCWG